MESVRILICIYKFFEFIKFLFFKLPFFQIILIKNIIIFDKKSNKIFFPEWTPSPEDGEENSSHGSGQGQFWEGFRQLPWERVRRFGAGFCNAACPKWAIEGTIGKAGEGSGFFNIFFKLYLFKKNNILNSKNF